MFSFGAGRALEKAREIIGQLEERIRTLLNEAESLRKENKKLREELAKKERRGKRQAAPFSRDKPKENPKKAGRKPGKEYGRRGQRRPPAHVDRVVDAVLPSNCPGCGGAVEKDRVEDQYQTDIPPVVPVVTHFRIHVGCCLDCGQQVRGRHPEQTSDAVGAAGQQIGPRALAIASHLHSVLGIPYGKVAHVFDRYFGLALVPSTLVRAQARLGTRSEGVYQELKLALREAPFVYPDETGWRIAGASAWLWVFVSRLITVYSIDRSRGRDVIENILGCDYDGAVGHDGWSSYGCLDKATHQTCLAHLLRRCHELLEAATGGAVRFPRAAQSLLLDALALRDRRDGGLISAPRLLSEIGELEARRDDLLDWSPSYEPNRLLRNHLDRISEQLFPFLRISGLEATNWPAEQAIRPAVANRKVCGGNRSDSGANALARLLTIFRTAQQQGRDPIAFLIAVMRTPLGYQLPSLLPPPYV